MVETLPRLSRRQALGEAAAEPVAHAQGDAVVIRIVAPRARFALRIDLSLLARAKTVAGFSLDMPINRTMPAGGRAAMRLGPDEWQLSGPENEAVQMAGELATALEQLHYALVDVGHARVTLAVSGPRAADVINSGCALDLAPASFPTGTATRTLLGKSEIILSKVDEQPVFEIECARSLANYACDFLREGARQYRAQV